MPFIRIISELLESPPGVTPASLAVSSSLATKLINCSSDNLSTPDTASRNDLEMFTSGLAAAGAPPPIFMTWLLPPAAVLATFMPRSSTCRFSIFNFSNASLARRRIVAIFDDRIAG